MYGTSFSHHALRSRGPPPPSSDYPGYQPPTAAQPYPPHHAAVSATSSSPNSKLDTVTATLDGLSPLIDSLKPSSDFEIGVSNVLRLLVGHVREIKLEQHMLRQFSERNFCEIDGSVTGLTRAVVKSEQYTRRDTVTVNHKY